jgi:hypothetical protein
MYTGGWNISDQHYWAVRKPHNQNNYFAFLQNCTHVLDSSHILRYPPPFHMQSVTFTAVPLFLVSMLWLMGFGVVLLVISCCCCFCRNKDNTYSPGCYVSSLVLLVTLTLATM